MLLCKDLCGVFGRTHSCVPLVEEREREERERERKRERERERESVCVCVCVRERVSTLKRLFILYVGSTSKRPLVVTFGN